MSIDVSQFHEVFFEESFEGLDAMESGLLNLSEGTPDEDAINTIFRAAHSIKGGAGTFGFMNVSEFTHVMETLLDEIRNGDRDVTTASTDLLLKAVDVLREMVTAVQQKAPTDDDSIVAIRKQLEAMLDGGTVEDDESESDSHDEVEVSEPQIIGWQIRFKPHPHLMQMGNDPARMFSELALLGKFNATVDDSNLPAFSDLEPEDCYLAWDLTLEGDIKEQDVVEVFEWVDEDADISIEPIMAELEPVEEIAEPAIEEELEDEVAVETVVQATENLEAIPQSVSSQPEAPKEASKASAAPAATSMRVGTDKVDSLINLVGELVITQSMLSQIGDNFTPEMLPQLVDGLAQLERNTREMQESIMRIRMLPISFAFNRFPRLVHDLTGQMGKQVELKLSGEQTELDKTVMEKIGDPLVHLVRNSLDHGLETPEVRLAAGKSEIGLLHLNAFHQGGNIIIEITDDGAGLNEDKILAKAIERGLVSSKEDLTPDKIHQLIFVPGFSTADVLTDVSGRGVGMDVVRKNIASLGGSVDVASEAGKGSTFTIRLPLTLAIMDGQTIRVADQKYILPLISIVESIEVKNTDIKHVSGKGELYPLRDEYVPVIRLYDVFGLEPNTTNLEEGLLVVVDGTSGKVGLFIDDLLGQQQVVIKSLETNYRKVMGLSGATILGDGTVALILDVQGLVNLYRDPSLAKLLTVDERVA